MVGSLDDCGCIVKYSEVIRKEGFDGELHRREGLGEVLSGQVDMMIFEFIVFFRIVLVPPPARHQFLTLLILIPDNQPSCIRSRLRI